MNKAVRTCLRTTPLALRCQIEVSNASRSRCLASSICPGRNHGSVAISASKLKLKTNGLGGGREGMSMGMRGREREMGRGYSTRGVEGVVEGRGIGDKVKVKIELEVPEGLDEKEIEIRGLLVERLDPVALNVKDVSGGCGTMYSIDVVSERFRGLSMLKQQRLVNEALGGMIKGWHGVMLKTKAPEG